MFSAARRLLHKLRKEPQMERTIYNLGHHLVVFLDVLGQRDKFEGLRKPTSTHRVDEKKYPDRVRAGAGRWATALCAALRPCSRRSIRPQRDLLFTGSGNLS